jgi:nicotinamidase/pyrazinamidase
MANALLIIDMLKGFLKEGCPLYCGEKAQKIIPNVKELIESEAKKGSKVFFICDSHAPDDAEFKMFPPHCIKGTEEAEIIPELAGYRGEVIPKTRYSTFYETALENKLKELNPEKVIVCGVCTDICVLHTVADLRTRYYDVFVPSDCVASFDQEAHKFALKHMEKVLGAHITTLKEM